MDGVTFTDWANLTGTAGNDGFTFAAAGSLSGIIDGAAGTDTVDVSAVPGQTVIVGTDITNVENLTGGGNNTIQATGTWVFSGDGNDGTVAGVAFTDFDQINVVGAGNVLDDSGAAYSQTVSLSGDATWNYTAGRALGSTITGAGNLDVPDVAGGAGAADISVAAGDLALPNLTSFAGHLIIGGVLNPLSPDARDAAVVQPPAIANSITVGSAIDSAGPVTLLANGITLNAGISAGGPGGAVLTLVAAQDDINGPASTPAIDLDAGSGFLIANGSFVNSENIRLNFNGGELTLAQGSGSTQNVAFAAGTQVSSSTTPLVNVNLLNSLGLTNLQAVQVVVLNPAAQLSGLDAVRFIDIGVFEEELSLFGVIGSGIAQELSQCEEIEGCAPSVTEDELIELIGGLEARIAELERRKTAGEVSADKADELLEGYRRQLSSFRGYLEQLRAYLAAQGAVAQEEEGAAEAESGGEDLGTAGEAPALASPPEEEAPAGAPAEAPVETAPLVEEAPEPVVEPAEEPATEGLPATLSPVPPAAAEPLVEPPQEAAPEEPVPPEELPVEPDEFEDYFEPDEFDQGL
ncbi:MAG: hypothetical protein D6786_06820 [Gammaproteobacteria bacterium]|nr:MAG: hypothetical protein D6786_06820 [Gammaproteobacteria bacterium]